MIPLMYDECRAQDAQLQAANIMKRRWEIKWSEKWCPENDRVILIEKRKYDSI